MSKPLMLRDEDDATIEDLRDRMGAPSKVAVVREGLALLEARLQREKRIERWVKAAAAARRTSREVNIDFRKRSRLRRT